MRIFVDFDGTITQRDTIVYLTERWGGGPEFRREILHGIEQGRMTVFEAIEKELSTVKVPWKKAARDLLENVGMDPDFKDFVAWCRARGHPLTVVSSGIRRVVDLFLGDLGLTRYAHPVEMRKTGWIYRRDPASDKKNILKRFQGKGRIVYVGDGTSDVEVIPLTDQLFATRYLAQYCRRHGFPFHPFQRFDEVRSGLERMERAGTL